MQDDCIAVALGLPQLKVIAQTELMDRFEVTIIYRQEQVTCPRCGQITTKEHERSLQRKQDRKLTSESPDDYRVTEYRDKLDLPLAWYAAFHLA